MAISSTSSSVNNLDSYYQQLINYQISIEQRPMDSLQKQVDDLKIQKALYSDLSTKFTGLQSSIKALLSSDPFYTLTPGRSASVTTSATQSVISATAGSAAIVGDYTIGITTLARGQTVRSDQQAYSDQSMNLSGTFVIGGQINRSVSGIMTSGAVSAFSTSGTLISGQTELGSNGYFVETRQTDTGTWQFRLVDTEGTAIEIRNESAGDDSLTSAWQDIPTGGGSYDTGRGLSFTFAADSGSYTANYRDSGAATVTYSAQGASIDVSASDTLEDIAGAINSATYADGNEIIATIVDKQLILQTKNTGNGKGVSAADSTGSVLQNLGVVDGLGAYVNYNSATDSARDASFTVNGLSVTRSKNTGLTDVITGVSLNLSPNSEGLSATLSVTADSTTQKTAIDSFIKKFNDVSTYVRSKTATTKNDDGTYTRGGLAGDMTFRLFSSDMFTTLNGQYANNGQYSYLFELGLEFNDKNELTVSDSTALTDALTNHFEDVELFLEKLMGTLNEKVGVFTGTTGYVESAIDLNENQTTYYSDRITSWQSRLDLRRTQLTNQYLEMQSQIEALTNQQQSLQAGFSSYQY